MAIRVWDSLRDKKQMKKASRSKGQPEEGGGALETCCGLPSPLFVSRLMVFAAVSESPLTLVSNLLLQ